MTSLSIDYLFNRVYDVLLWMKYMWLFVLLRKNPDDYLAAHLHSEFDGLRDRGWFAQYLQQKDAVVPAADVHISLWERLLEVFGVRAPDSDADGIPDISDPSPFDPANLSSAQLKERYQEDYTFGDNFRSFFGLGPTDSDKDGVPNSYEIAHSLDPNNGDTDRDGIFDGQELVQGTDPLNNDTDGDLVLDGRDEAPLDPTISSSGIDSDGDGISDKVEGLIGSDPFKKDSDSDGIPDNMDTYPVDENNVSQLTLPDLHKAAEGIHLSVQNPVLSLFNDLLSIMAIAIILVLIYAIMRWLIIFIEGLNHYEHHFIGDDHHKGDHGAERLHTIRDGSAHTEMPAGIANLPVYEEAPAPPPTPADFEDHPRFAIVQGYMSSNSEALWRIGILEADNMLAQVLRDKGYAGETVSDMLKEASFKTIRLAWDAHMTRNRIAHQGSDFQLTEREAKLAFTNYSSVFRELKVIR